METNVAPEKIYIACDVITEEGRAFILEKPVSYLKSVEYTRTDAFIEKAVKYIANHFLAPGMDNEINDFTNYMKGE